MKKIEILKISFYLKNENKIILKLKTILFVAKLKNSKSK